LNALQESALSVLSIDKNNTQVELRRRQRSIILTAIDWYFSTEGLGNKEFNKELKKFFIRPSIE